jgi:hypothetical protein
MPNSLSSGAAYGYAKEVLKERTCVLQTCTKCGRQDYQMEAETGFCLVCIGKELEAS